MTALDLNTLTPGKLIEHYCDVLAWNVIRAKGKKPVGSWKRFQTTKSTPKEREMLKRHVEGGGTPFLICGAVSGGVVVLDLDSDEATARWRSRLSDTWDRIPKATTPSGGYHLFLRSNGHTVGGQGGDDWDLKAEGGGVVLPSGNGTRKWEVPPNDDLPAFALIEQHLIRDARKDTRPDAGEQIAQGGRDDALTSLAGAMRRAGMTGAAILAALHVENDERCDPPLDRADVERIARSVARYPTEHDTAVEKKYNHLRADAEARRRLQADSAVMGSREIHSLADAEQAADAPIDWVIPRLLAAGDKAVIAGPPKSLKTWFALNLVQAITAPGRPCDEAQWEVPSSQSVLFVQEEGTHQRWAQRLMAIAEEHPDAPISYAHRTGVSLLNEASVAWLIEKATEVEARVIFLDPLQRITPGVNENDASDVGPAWDAIHKIASDTGAAVVVIHHARKGSGEPTMDSIRGSSRVAGEVDLMFVLRRVDRGTLELYLEGRDLPPRPDREEGNLEIKYDVEAPHRMRIDGTRLIVKGPVNQTRPAVEKVLRKASGPLTTAAIMEQVDRDRSAINRVLNDLNASGRVRRSAGKGKGYLWEWAGD